MIKKWIIILVCLISIILLSCATSPSGNASSNQKDIDKVMNSWIRALTTEDLDLLMSTYWSDAVMETIFGEEKKQHIGEKEIKIDQGSFFEGSDVSAEMNISVVDRVFNNEEPEYTCEVSGPGFTVINRFKFEKRNGEWKIIHQLIEPPPAE